MTQPLGNYYGILVRLRERIEVYPLLVIMKRGLGCRNWMMAAQLCDNVMYWAFSF
jgi:hypothetical protein